jgi:hypothetical protein
VLFSCNQIFLAFNKLYNIDFKIIFTILAECILKALISVFASPQLTYMVIHSRAEVYSTPYIPFLGENTGDDVNAGCCGEIEVIYHVNRLSVQALSLCAARGARLIPFSQRLITPLLDGTLIIPFFGHKVNVAIGGGM